MNTDWKALCTELAKELAEEYGVQREFDDGDPLLGSGAIELLSRARAAFSQPEPVPVSADTAFAIGQTGGPPSEVERLAFEAWMRGHSWLVSGEWNGTTYVDPQERHSSIDLLAMQTRMLWAAWRDRAALARPEPEVPTDRARVEALEAAQRAIASPSSNRTHLGLTQNAPESSDSLVDLVASAISNCGNVGPIKWWTPEARAAIREVADWLDQQHLHTTAARLRQEVW